MISVLWLGVLAGAQPPVSPGTWWVVYARVAACALVDRTELARLNSFQ